MTAETWPEVLAAPSFVINLERCPDRLATAKVRLAEAGFTDIRVWPGTDAKALGDAGLQAAWAAHGSPKMDTKDREFCVSYKGKQGCMLSHLNILKHVISSPECADIGYFNVFEDDILFHPQWDALAPQFYAATPKDFDILFMGNQLDQVSKHSIIRVPCFTTNALSFTRAGAKKLYDFLLSQPAGVRTIDCMIKDHQSAVVSGRGRPAFNWYNWNATMFPCPESVMPKDWTKRNMGLVFQDFAFESEVRPW